MREKNQVNENVLVVDKEDTYQLVAIKQKEQNASIVKVLATFQLNVLRWLKSFGTSKLTWKVN